MEQGLFKKIVSNALKLATGKVGGGVLAFIALIFAGKGLSTEGFGALMLIFSYIYLVATIGTCPCWQVAVHFGSPSYRKGDIETTSKSVSFAYSIEIIATILIVLASLLITYIGYCLDLFSQKGLLLPTLLACLFIPGRTMNASYGTLRLVDKIHPVAISQAVTPALRAIFCFFAMISKAKLIFFVLAWGIPLVLGDFYLLGSALYSVSKTPIKIRPTLRIITLSKELPKGVWKLLISGTLTRLVDRTWDSLTPLIIGWASGAIQGGLVALALNVVNACKAPAALLEQSYYPEISKADPKHKDAWRLTFKLCVISGLIGILVSAILYFGGKDIIALFGKRYIESSLLISWMAPSLIFALSTLSLEAILFTAGKATSIVWTEYSAAILYLFILTPVALKGDPFLNSMAYILGQAILGLMMTVLAVYTYKHRYKIIQPHEH